MENDHDIIEANAFYEETIRLMYESDIPYLIGGGFAAFNTPVFRATQKIWTFFVNQEIAPRF